MKKVLYILMSAGLALLASCAKEATGNDPATDAPRAEGETITFTAKIVLAPETRAALEDLESLDIVWSSGDYIGVATDNSATIVAYPVENIDETGTSCTVTVDAVEGATAYYAIFRGSLNGETDDQKVDSDDFSGITFDTSTKTFSGLTVGKQQVASGSIYSYLWHSNGFPLSMAGKSSGNTLTLKPCLALFRLRMDAESVPTDNYLVSETYNNPAYNVNHPHSYSAVRGFNFYQVGASSVYSSGDFTVQVGDDGSITTAAVVNDNKSAYRQLSQSGKLLADNDYLMCVIPGGNISSLKIDFLGYADNTGALSWDAVYTMTKTGDMTVKPGDCYSLGTLNPLGRKKAKTHAEDDAADEAAAFTPAITIDGAFTDWDDVSHVIPTQSNRIVEWKYTKDKYNLYFLYKITAAKIVSESETFDWSPYIYIGFDTDNDATSGNTGENGGTGAGMEARAMIFPWRGATSGTPQCVIGEDANSEMHYPVGTNNGHVTMGGQIVGDYCYLEVKIPLASIGNPTGPITVNHAMSYYATGAKQIMPEATVITAGDQTVGVGQTVAIGATANSGAAITYVSNNTSVATVDADGVITGVATGSTTITLSAAAVEGEYAAATKTINVEVTAAFTPAITIDGDMSDWAGIVTLPTTTTSRITAWKFKSDERYVYFYFELNKSRVDSTRDLYLGFDFDETGSYNDTYNMQNCEIVVKCHPFTNANGTDPVCVNGFVPDATINGTSDANAVKAYASVDSAVALEVSVPRNKLSNLPSSGVAFNIAASFNQYWTGFQSLALE